MVETAAMRSGKERHAILEAETALDQVTVEVETREDRFALRLINMAQGLKQLMLEGITRELMIFGILQVLLVVMSLEILGMPAPATCRMQLIGPALMITSPVFT